jgi:hypothetical protein
MIYLKSISLHFPGGAEKYFEKPGKLVYRGFRYTK